MYNWASEASPTLGCSIEIRVILCICNVCMYVCRYVFDCLWENNTKNCMLESVGGIM